MAGGVHGGGRAWQGVCMVGGVHGRDGHVWQGACMAEGPAWQRDVHGRQGRAWQEAGEMATAADGTHPTGMHSCLNSLFIQKVQSNCFINYPYTLINSCMHPDSLYATILFMLVMVNTHFKFKFAKLNSTNVCYPLVVTNQDLKLCKGCIAFH